MAMSWTAYAISWALYFVFYFKKRATQLQIMNHIKNNWTTSNGPQTVPKKITADPDLKVESSVFESTQQEWECFHMKHKSKESRLVVVYWHGGAWINPMAPQHWQILQNMVKKCPVEALIPMYTMAPLSHATAWESAAVDYLFSLLSSPKHREKKFVLAGDSAGGFFALRLLQVLCEIVVQNKEGLRRQQALELLQRIHCTIMISPVMSLAVTEETKQTALNDIWLSLNLFRTVGPLWAYGPSAFPDFDFGLEEGQGVPSINPSSASLHDPKYSPCSGMDILKDYKVHVKEASGTPFHLITAIGTYDICHASTMEMHRNAIALGKDVIQADLFEEPGLYHVYPLFPSPESKRFWKRVYSVLSNV